MVDYDRNGEMKGGYTVEHESQMPVNKYVATTSFRNDGIDMLRGMSILAVILLHCLIHMPVASDILPQNIFNVIFRSGYYGVIIFFVISGFLITGISIKKWGALQHVRVGQFYQMRFARIFPCLLALIALLSVLHCFGVPGFVIHTTSLSQAIFSALTFHINWLEVQTGYLPGNWDVLWSLSVEEMFYLFFPLLCVTLKKTSYIASVMLIFIILGPFARTVFTDNEMWSDHSYLSCMDGIAIGCLAALLSSMIKLNKAKFMTLLFAGLSLFILIFVFRKLTYNIGISPLGLNVTLLEISVGMILMSMNEWYGNGKRVGNILTAPLRMLGRNSYEVYLTHSLIIMMATAILFNAAQYTFLILCWYVVVIVLSGILGLMISLYFSEPLSKYIRKQKVTSRHLTFG